MKETVTLFLVISVLLVLGIFGFYLLRTYLFPKKVGELEEMLKAGHIVPAIKKLQKMIEENPRDPYLHSLLARAHSMSKDQLSAVMEYKQAIKYLEIGVTSPHLEEKVARRKLAKLYLKLKNYDEAKKEFLILTKIDEKSADNFYQVGLLFQKSGLLNKAFPYFQNAIKMDSSHADAFYQLGQLQYNMGSAINEATTNLKEAVRLNPENYSAHYYLALCYKSNSNFDQAMKELTVALRDEKIRGQVHLARALCYLEKDDIIRAEAGLNAALEIASEKSELELNSRYHLSLLLERKRDFQGAISHWERISKINPKYKDVAEKLKTYQEFRTDDSVKDFLIAPSKQFENFCKKITTHLNFDVFESQLESDAEMRLFCYENDLNVRSKRTICVVYIFRTLDPVGERTLRQLTDNMHSFSANHGICITTGTFTTQAKAFAKVQDIQLKDAEETIDILRTVV